MIPAHKYYNREFMPHEFQLIHNTFKELYERVKYERKATVIAMVEHDQLVARAKEAMEILESKR